ncbi:hypothetical protein ACQSDJ_14140 [Salmonella enterica]|uniref:hypothetical protein n=1 Tax=Salmonella enterica TaxID=28901 RepID=UPI003D31E1A1
MIIIFIAFFATKLINDADYEMMYMPESLQAQPASRFSLLLTTGGFSFGAKKPGLPRLRGVRFIANMV